MPLSECAAVGATESRPNARRPSPDRTTPSHYLGQHNPQNRATILPGGLKQNARIDDRLDEPLQARNPQVRSVPPTPLLFEQVPNLLKFRR
jgi:hypothetical protein